MSERTAGSQGWGETTAGGGEACLWPRGTRLRAGQALAGGCGFWCLGPQWWDPWGTLTQARICFHVWISPSRWARPSYERGKSPGPSHWLHRHPQPRPAVATASPDSPRPFLSGLQSEPLMREGEGGGTGPHSWLCRGITGATLKQDLCLDPSHPPSFDLIGLGYSQGLRDFKRSPDNSTCNKGCERAQV